MTGVGLAHFRRQFCFLGVFSWGVGLAMLAGGCSGKSEPVAANFVGQWKSSRLATALHLHDFPAMQRLDAEPLHGSLDDPPLAGVVRRSEGVEFDELPKSGFHAAVLSGGLR